MMDALIMIIVIALIILAFMQNYLWLAGILGMALVLLVLFKYGSEYARGEKISKEALAPVQLPAGTGWPSWDTWKSILTDAGSTAGSIGKNIFALDRLLKEQFGSKAGDIWAGLGSKKKTKPWEMGSAEIEDFLGKRKTTLFNIWSEQLKSIEAVEAIDPDTGKAMRKKLANEIKKALK